MTAGVGLPDVPFGTQATADSAVVMPSAVAVAPPTVSELERIQHGRGVRAGRHEQLCAPVEGDEPDLDALGQVLHERLGLLLHGLQPRGRDVGRGHRAGRVEREQDRGALLRGPHGHRRLGEREGEHDQRDEQRGGRDVPLPPRPLGRDGVEEVDAGEAQDLGVPAPLHDHVGDEERGGSQEQDERQPDKKVIVRSPTVR